MTVADVARALKRKYRSDTAAGRVVGVTGTTLKRWLDGEPMSIERALLSAIALDLPADVVLHATEHSDALDLITELFGEAAARPRLDATAARAGDELKLLDHFSALDSERRATIVRLAGDLRSAQEREQHERRHAAGE